MLRRIQAAAAADGDPDTIDATVFAATPLDAAVNYVLAYCDDGLPRGGAAVPFTFFHHRLVRVPCSASTN